MIGPPVAMPWTRLAPFVGLWLTPWLFQSGFVGSSSGFVGSSKWLHRADTRTPSPFGRNPRYAPMRQVNLLTPTGVTFDASGSKPENPAGPDLGQKGNHLGQNCLAFGFDPRVSLSTFSAG